VKASRQNFYNSAVLAGALYFLTGAVLVGVEKHEE
jgi:hypothetical protein